MKTDVRIFPFIGISNTFCFSATGILRCKGITGAIQEYYVELHFSEVEFMCKKNLKHLVQHSEKLSILLKSHLQFISVKLPDEALFL